MKSRARRSQFHPNIEALSLRLVPSGLFPTVTPDMSLLTTTPPSVQEPSTTNSIELLTTTAPSSCA